MKLFCVAITSVLCTSVAFAQLDEQIVPKIEIASLIAMDKSIESHCRNNSRCIKSFYESLATTTIGELHFSSQHLLGEIRSLNGNAAVAADVTRTHIAMAISDSQFEEFKQQGLTADLRRRILSLLTMAKKDNTRLRVLRDSLLK